MLAIASIYQYGPLFALLVVSCIAVHGQAIYLDDTFPKVLSLRFVR